MTILEQTLLRCELNGRLTYAKLWGTCWVYLPGQAQIRIMIVQQMRKTGFRHFQTQWQCWICVDKVLPIIFIWNINEVRTVLVYPKHRWATDVRMPSEACSHPPMRPAPHAHTCIISLFRYPGVLALVGIINAALQLWFRRLVLPFHTS